MRWASPPLSVPLSPAERQVSQADIAQEPEPGADFLDQLLGDAGLEFRELQPGDERVRLIDRERAQVHDGKPGNRGRAGRGIGAGCRRSEADPDGKDLGFEAASPAGIAELRAHERLKAIAGELAFALGVEPLQVGKDALERTGDVARLARPEERERDGGFAGSEQERGPERLRELAVGSLETLLVMGRHAAQERFVVGNHPFPTPAPRQDRALLQRFGRVRHHERRVKHQLLSQSMADGAGAGGGVEGEMFRRERLVALSRRRAQVAVREHQFGPESSGLLPV